MKGKGENEKVPDEYVPTAGAGDGLWLGAGWSSDGTDFTVLHRFTPTFQSPYTNSDGAASPYGGLTVLGNTLFGTAEFGGSTGNGVVFKLNIDGTAFTVLHNFSSLITNNPGAPYNSDGANPMGTLMVSGDTLYGTTGNGGGSGYGTVFAMKTDSGGFKTLHSFTNNPPSPPGGLVLSGTNLFGLCGGEGGTLFKLSVDGASFSTHLLNWDDVPIGGLSLCSNTLYGVTFSASTFASTIFDINTDGTNFNTIYSFSGGINGYAVVTNASGADPNRNLTISGNTVFGTTWLGGIYANGVVFRVNTDGTGFRTLYNFTDSDDVMYPLQGLILSNGVLYGTVGSSAGSVWGGPGYGSVFSINSDGTSLRTLHTFNAVDGGLPVGLIVSGTTLYGMTAQSYSISDVGTIFSITLPPSLSLTTSGQNLVVSWPTNSTGFTIQSTTTLASPVWTTNLPPPVVVNGQYTITTPLSGAQQFFRLRQ